MNKYNLWDYDNQRELITTIYGTNDIVEDIKQIYDEHYKIVSDDLYKNAIFDDNDYEITNNELRKVVVADNTKHDKKKNNDTRF